MSKIKNIIERCSEIIKIGEDLLESQESDFIRIKTISKINTSIENIYNLCFPNGIPDHLRLGNFIRTLTNLGVNKLQLNAIGIFLHRLESFKGFKEDLEKGLITRDLVKTVTLDIYNDLIDQAQNLRAFNTDYSFCSTFKKSFNLHTCNFHQITSISFVLSLKRLRVCLILLT